MTLSPVFYSRPVCRRVFVIPLLSSLLDAIIDGILSVATKFMDKEMFQLSSKRKLVMVLILSALG